LNYLLDIFVPNSMESSFARGPLEETGDDINQHDDVNDPFKDLEFADRIVDIWKYDAENIKRIVRESEFGNVSTYKYGVITML